MRDQVRAWMFKRLKILHIIWMDRLHGAFGTLRAVNETQGAIRIDHWAMKAMNKILDMYSYLDIMVRARTNGFLMGNGVDPRLARINGPSQEGNITYGQIDAQSIAELRKTTEECIAQQTTIRRAQGPLPEFLDAFCLNTDRTVGHRMLQPHIINPPDTKIERWVQELSDEKVEIFDFVVYRIVYTQSDDEWDNFSTMLENGLDSVWDELLARRSIKLFSNELMDATRTKSQKGIWKLHERIFRTSSNRPHLSQVLQQGFAWP